MLAIRVAGIFLNLLVSIVLARAFGAADVGEYFVYLSLLNGTALFAGLGLPKILTRHGSISQQSGDEPQLLRMFGTTILIVGGASIVTCVALSIAKLGLGDGRLDVAIVMATITATVPFSLKPVFVAILRVRDQHLVGSFIENVPLPTIFIGLLVLVLISPQSVAAFGALAPFWFHVVATIVVFAVLVPITLRHTKVDLSLSNLRTYTRQHFHEASSVFGVDMLNYASAWSATFVLLVMVDVEAVGEYSVCWRLAAAATLPILVVNSLMSPKYAAVSNTNNEPEFRQLARDSASLSTVVGGLLCGVMYLARDSIVALFGQDFIDSGPLLAVMLAGTFVSVLTGSAGNLLVMSGLAKSNFRISVFSVLLQISTSIAGAHYFGVMGAAVAFSIQIAIKNILFVVSLYRHKRVISLPSLRSRFYRGNN